MRIRKLLAAAAVAGTVMTAGLATAQTASANSLADCAGSGDVCLYFNSWNSGHGAVFVQGWSISNYDQSYFSSSAYGSSGNGVVVKNNAAAVDSWYGGTFTVYYNSGDHNCSYACQDIPAWGYADLNSTMKNNNAAGFYR